MFSTLVELALAAFVTETMLTMLQLQWIDSSKDGSSGAASEAAAAVAVTAAEQMTPAAVPADG